MHAKMHLPPSLYWAPRGQTNTSTHQNIEVLQQDTNEKLLSIMQEPKNNDDGRDDLASIRCQLRKREQQSRCSGGVPDMSTCISDGRRRLRWRMSGRPAAWRRSAAAATVGAEPGTPPRAGLRPGRPGQSRRRLPAGARIAPQRLRQVLADSTQRQSRELLGTSGRAVHGQ